MRKSTHGLREGAEARPRCVWAGLAETCDPHHDQAAVEFVQDPPADTPALHSPRPKSIEQHVGTDYELFQDISSGGIAYVQRHAFLVPAHNLPKDAFAFFLISRSSKCIAARMLDFDDFS